MSERNFNGLLDAQWEAGRFLCVGLDPDLEKIPVAARVEGVRETIVNFNRAVINATKDIVCAYKPNSAFYEAHGETGWAALQQTIEDVHELAPEVPVILDAKRGDIGNTNNGYVAAAFRNLNADALTVHPYMGGESLKEFLTCADKGIFVMCRNSNPGAGEFQDLDIAGEPLYIHIAKAFGAKWNSNGNCGLVVGATYPDEIKEVRAIVPEMTFLIPGTGAQGGDLASSVKNGQRTDGKGFILSTTRAIVYASDRPDYQEVIRKKAEEFDGAIRAAL
ncbi:MAG: orotidine-5'-phosphate decarboxylase [Candidatus Kaiserbacteria bacterium]|nr:orotidine-5'-phosphate decarboxylase [Candidatus Kaiserbacteria bacterium]